MLKYYVAPSVRPSAVLRCTFFFEVKERNRAVGGQKRYSGEYNDGTSMI